MPSNPDPFETYLKHFRPVPAQELSFERAPHPNPRFRFWWGWAAFAATVLLGVLLKFQGHSIKDRLVTRARASSPLTLCLANTDLFADSSSKRVLDRLAFPSQHPLQEGQQSALKVLGQEPTKL